MSPPDNGWSNTDELLALLAELVDHSNRQFHAAHLKGSPPKPLRVPRPHEQAQQTEPLKPATVSEMKEFFAGAAQFVPTEGGPQ